MTTSFLLSQLPDIVLSTVKPLVSQYRILTLQGPLGAGKTTLAKELIKQLGVGQEATSLTFTYVNTYTSPAGLTIYHFDLYRIQTLDEFITQGFDEYLNDAGALSVIEWPEIILPLLSHEPLASLTKQLTLAAVDQEPNQRTLHIR